MKTKRPSDAQVSPAPPVRGTAQAPTESWIIIDASAAHGVAIRKNDIAELKAKIKSRAKEFRQKAYLRKAEQSHGVETPARKVSFGSVTVFGRTPSKGSMEQSIRAGQQALERMRGALLEPGVVLPRKRGVPLYRASADDSSILIRELDGKEERVKLVDGVFVTVG